MNKLLFWCCPRRRAPLDQPLLDQPQDQQIPEPAAEPPPPIPHFQPPKPELKEIPLRTKAHSSEEQRERISIKASFENQTHNHRKMSSPRNEQNNVIKYKKSHLWSEVVKSDLIYMNLTKENPIYMSYRLVRNRESKSPNVLDYHLSKNKSSLIAVIGKENMIRPKLDTLDKYNHKVINLVLGPNTQRDKQHPGSSELVFIEKLCCLRWSGIDQIVILTEGLHTYEQICLYVNRVLKFLNWGELKKITYLFPNFMSIDQISLLLFPIMSQYALNESIEKASLDLSFEMELIDGANLDSGILVKSRSQEVKEAQAAYDQVKTSIAFFGKVFNDNTQVLYRDFYKIMRDQRMKSFFLLKDKYAKNTKQFRMKVKEMQRLNPDQYNNLQRCPQINERDCDLEGYYISIPVTVREKIGQLYNVAELKDKEVDTPVRKGWDDDANAEDFKVRTKKKLDEITEAEMDQIVMLVGLKGDDEDDDYGLLSCDRRPQDDEDYLGEEDDMHLLMSEEVREQSDLGSSVDSHMYYNDN